jgi:hypothetical protein
MAEIVSFFGEPNKDEIAGVRAVCTAATVLRDVINDFCPESFESEKALERLHEALMWANAAILGSGDDEE